MSLFGEKLSAKLHALGLCEGHLDNVILLFLFKWNSNCILKSMVVQDSCLFVLHFTMEKNIGSDSKWSNWQ